MAPTEEEIDDVLLAARYGEDDDVKTFTTAHGIDALAAARDDNGNTVLHMAAANGHTELLTHLLDTLPADLARAQNAAGSTALHWAALNKHLAAAQALVARAGASLIDVRNATGRSPLGEAENVGWEDGARWLVGAMDLGVEAGGKEEEEEGDASAVNDVEVEITDAEGGVARMTLAKASSSEKETTTG